MNELFVNQFGLFYVMREGFTGHKFVRKVYGLGPSLTWAFNRGPEKDVTDAWLRSEDGQDFQTFAKNMADEITENFSHIEMDLDGEGDEEAGRSYYSQDELARLTDEWEASGSSMPFEVWLGGRTRQN